MGFPSKAIRRGSDIPIEQIAGSAYTVFHNLRNANRQVPDAWLPWDSADIADQIAFEAIVRHIADLFEFDAEEMGEFNLQAMAARYKPGWTPPRFRR